MFLTNTFDDARYDILVDTRTLLLLKVGIGSIASQNLRHGQRWACHFVKRALVTDQPLPDDDTVGCVLTRFCKNQRVILGFTSVDVML